VLDKYGFHDKITRLDRADLLYQVVAKFTEIGLSEHAVPNDAMGHIFEELLRRFSEMSNETAGEHFTPREVIRLMVNILFVEDDQALSGVKPVRTLYDPACGTGGMLTVAQDHLRELNPDGLLEVYGQELNPETWAVCRSDMMIKGQDPTRIILGNSFTEDGHEGTRFDYMLANPPFGVDWKKYADPIKAEHGKLGHDGRFGPGLPRVSDGSLLFLLHMISKMKPVKEDPSTPNVIEGGSRLAIVFSGSPLFAGAAGGGESEIRRWIIENDWLEGIVALPDQMFYNTGISTYFWVLTNRKRPERDGKIALIDARQAFAKMSKSLGNKRNYIPDDAIAEATRLYADAIELDGKDPRVKVFPSEAFGYQRITVERPLRRRWELTDEVVARLPHHKQWAAWLMPPRKHPDPVAFTHQAEADQERLLDVLRGLLGQVHATESAFKTALVKAADAAGIAAPGKLVTAIIAEAAVPDPDTPIITDRKGGALPDPDLRDQENVPLGEDVEEYLKREVLPYAPDAWIDHSKTKIGYEIPFMRHFYVYEPPRPVAEIDAELQATESRIRELLEGLAG
jgi:type I restriction enzyme M protein